MDRHRDRERKGSVTGPGETAKILVAMSGGVDSSVAALLLKRAGYEVAGATMRLWVNPSLPDPPAGGEKLSPGKAVLMARRVASEIGIAHHVLDLEDEFYRTVVCDFTASYAKGRTPNPCIECNRTIKFSAFLRAARGLGFDKIATGHYARSYYDAESGRFRLFKSRDSGKDQSYMLYVLGPGELASTIFPLGDLDKQQVRELAAACLPEVAAGRESQDICFIPDGDYHGFLKRHLPQAVQTGDIVSGSGKKLGRHEGIAFYTVGQRRGLGLTAPEPYFVLGIDAKNNRVIVGPAGEVFSGGLLAGRLNFVSGITPGEEIKIGVKIRYRAPAVPALLCPPREGRARVIFEAPQRAVAPGQSAVFYSGDEVLGGGIIEKALPLV